MSWVVPFLAVSRASSGRQTACWLLLITLAGRVRGRVMLSSWLEEGSGRQTRTRIAVATRNSILRLIVLHFAVLEL